MRRILTLALVSSLIALAAACAAPTDAPEEALGSTEQELTKADPLFGSVCRACGCSMVSRVIDGCTVTRCECPTVRDAECVVNAPGGAAAVLVPPPPTRSRLDGAFPLATAVAP